MRIVCPSCQAAYEVPEKMLTGTPRKVRCARCGNNWVPELTVSPIEVAPSMVAPEAVLHAAVPEQAMPPAEPAPTPKQALPEPPAMGPRVGEKLTPEPDDRQAGHRTARLAGLGWAASIAVLAGAGWAAVFFRADVMAVWAPSRRLFDLLGLR